MKMNAGAVDGSPAPIAATVAALHQCRRATTIATHRLGRHKTKHHCTTGAVVDA
jgi:hypothetical protein